LQIAYSEELHTYLKTTGLHASDLVKPKPKKNPRDRSGPTASHLNHPQQHQLVQTAGGQAPVPSASAASTLTTAGQQLIQTLLGLQPSLATSAAAGDATAALAQALAGQPVQQVLFRRVMYHRDSVVLISRIRIGSLFVQLFWTAFVFAVCAYGRVCSVLYCCFFVLLFGKFVCAVL